MPFVITNSGLLITMNISGTMSWGAAPAPASAPLGDATNFSLAVGTGAGQANAIITQDGTINTGTPNTVNVITGLQTDQLTAAAMAHVLAIYFENLSSTPADIVTIGGGTHPLIGSDQCTVNAGGAILIYNPNPGYAITSGSADTLTFGVAAGSGVPYQLVIVGRNT